MTRFDELVQGSQDWLQARVGKVTASRVSDVVAKTKSGWGPSRENYMAELLVERRSGRAYEQYVNAAMQWGSDTESLAVESYCLRDILLDVQEVGFVQHPSIPMAGASPDRLVGDDGLLEVKCPNSATHLRTIEGAAIDGKYLIQMQFQMACTGRQWCDFASFDPREPDLPLCVRRVTRNHTQIVELERNVREFLAELDERLANLKHIISGKSDLLEKLQASVAKGQ